ncbi:kinase-like protein [Punctularia strigosozonata HHB-11173 SS5]|uniref:kinase-like protein n=1 Tax=Punctularia strigosozonata (strain HHB-11173) TaxID=741275 RepID=UPI0004417DBC|nr:kinase-like protein [Punctularia strigosozonata HHB-11173 SS5]EIN07578.1 kinase-like protein [Punctularia strigosozonata HHB-11173 SS5]
MQQLDSLSRTSPAYRRTLRELRSVCGKNGMLPRSCWLLDPIRSTDEGPRSFGGFADVWRGTHNGVTVALKLMRLNYGEQAEFGKVLCKEVVMWRRLSHPNIVPFLGVAYWRQRICIVSQWMEHEDVMSYLKRFPQANRLAMITDIARGLKYMHESGVVHGDMKPRNVLIDSARRARLSDFGLAVTAFGTQSLALESGTSSHSGTVRYMAPELSDQRAEGQGLTKEADVYGFGMTSWEIFDGRIPFPELRSDYAVLIKVQRGERPSRPAVELVDNVWALMKACWCDDPSARPSSTYILTQREGPYDTRY